MTDEQRELIRQCAQRIVENHEIGRVVDAVSLEWARRFVAQVPPLGRPVASGEPPAGAARQDAAWRGRSSRLSEIAA